jgi:FlgD Ig-like domain
LPRLAVIVLVLLLLAGTAAAFAITESLKLERSPITAPRFDKRFSPVCGCPTDRAALTFRLRRADHLDASIVDRSGTRVRRLVDDERYGRGEVTFHWDGHDDAGAVVPDGPYRLEIHLNGAHRTIVVPNTVLVDTKPPAVELLRVRRRVFSPNGDGVNDRLVVVYRASEKGAATLLVDGRVAVRGKTRLPRRQRLKWGGKLSGRPLAPGAYDLTLEVRDIAGNVSPPRKPIEVAIRALRVTRQAFEARRGGMLRFRVATDALPFRWELVRDGRTVVAGRSAKNVVRLPLPREFGSGAYTLVVSSSGQSDRAVVTVHGRSR